MSHEFQVFGCRFEVRCWGVFVAEDGSRHVAPCTPEEYLAEPHQLDWRCPCSPEYVDGICAHNIFHVEH